MVAGRFEKQPKLARLEGFEPPTLRFALALRYTRKKPDGKQTAVSRSCLMLQLGSRYPGRPRDWHKVGGSILIAQGAAVGERIDG